MPHFVNALCALLIPSLALAACSGSDSDDGPSGAGGFNIQVGQGGNGNGTGSTGSQNQNGGNGSGSGSSQGCVDTSTDVCGGANFEVESIPLDIYIMFDQSGSMITKVTDAGNGITRMAAVQQAVSTFLKDRDTAGIGVGIGYFGVQPIGQVNCDPAAYASPDVQVSDNHDAVIASLSKRMPTGETPTSAALNGACGYAQGYFDAHSNHKVVILLVTDGKPEAPVSCGNGVCCPTLDQATQEAKNCLNSKQQIPTYVLGVGPNLENLHAIAQAGGTKTAYLVGDQDVSANVLAALNSIRRAAQIPCQFEIPMAQSGTTDLEKVNIHYAQGNCDFKPIYYVNRAESCPAEGGWYFDNPNSPAFIKLCKASCDSVSSTASALRVSVGCARQEPPIR